MRRNSVWLATALAAVTALPAAAQLTVPLTGFEVDREGAPLVAGNPAGYSSFQEVLLQDPRFSATTSEHIISKFDWEAVDCDTCDGLEDSLEESYVESFYGGADGSAQTLVTFWSWEDPTNADRWARIVTRQPPKFANPVVHLDGQVRMRLRIDDFGFGASNLDLAFALLIRETDSVQPLGFNGGVVPGGLEFVGVSGLLNADTNGVLPIPSPGKTFFGPTASGNNDFVDLVFNFATDDVYGWTAEGGDGVLDGAKGVIDSLVVMPVESNALTRDVLIMIDEIEIIAPAGYNDPAIAPTVAQPLVATDNMVQVNDIITSATQVILEVDRGYGEEFTADETYNQPVSGATFASVGPISPLAIGDAVRAAQVAPAGTSPYSTIVEITPPPPLSITMSLDQDGNFGGSPADFDFVGATGVRGSSTPTGKPLFPECGVWQNIEFSLVPGVEPVRSFAGGYGFLLPDGGFYNVDSFFFSIGTAEPDAGPHDVYIDNVYYVDQNDNQVMLYDMETQEPYTAFRAQSTTTNRAAYLADRASFQGNNSWYLGWTWPDAGFDNTIAPYGTNRNFPDSAKAVGLWVLYEDCGTNGPVRPVIPGPLVGNAGAVQVTSLDAANLLSVDLYVNGVSAGSVGTTGLTAVTIMPDVELVVGDLLTATQTTTEGTSVSSLPRAVSTPTSPAVQGPLMVGQTSVTVTGLLTAPSATASEARIYVNGAFVQSAAAGSASVAVTGIFPALRVGDRVSAAQVVNGAESAPSIEIGVGAGEPPRVVINEFQYDDAPVDGADTREFVELYNADDEPIDLSGWTLRAWDILPPGQTDNPEFTVADGAILNPGDFYVLGNATVPNVDQVLTEEGSQGLWENRNEVIELIDTNGVIIDAVSYENVLGELAAAPSEPGLWGTFVSENNSQASIQRYLDGRDTDNNGRDFTARAGTPGTTNSTGIVHHFAGPDVDGLAPELEVEDFWGAYVNFKVVNPTVVSDSNPTAVPASPQGGNAMVTWDPVGGGNPGGSLFTMPENSSYDIWVYMDATTVGFTEEWNIGIGSSDMWYPNNLFGTYTGDTGVSWIFRRTATDSFLQLADHGWGGALNARSILGEVDLDAGGYAPGWYRLAIYTCGNSVVGYFGDSSGQDIATFRGALEEPFVGSFYARYREYATGLPPEIRPPLIDMRVPTEDCQPNGTPDVLEIADGSVADCNCNQVPDACEANADCDASGSLDTCQLQEMGDVSVSDSCVDAPLVAPGVYTGSTVGRSTSGIATCGDSASSPAVYYRFRPLEDGVLTASLCRSEYDTAVSIHSACDASVENELACRDDFCGVQSQVSADVVAGQDYFIRVTGWRGSAGVYRLSIFGVDGVAGLNPANCNANASLDACESLSFGDFTGDGSASLDDLAGLNECMAGPGVSPAPAVSGCEAFCTDVFDSDADGDVDLRDGGQFFRELGGE